MDVTQENVTGRVSVRLRRGTLTVCGRSADRSLYDPRLGSFTMEESFEPKHAEGFIRLFGLPSRGAGASNVSAPRAGVAGAVRKDGSRDRQPAPMRQVTR